MKHTTIHKEGYAILLGFFFVYFIIGLVVWLKFLPIVFAILAVALAPSLIVAVRFFRKPHRIFETDDPNLIVAPCDGVVVVIEPTDEPEYFGDKRLQVSIFMNVFNVHINWYPIAGKVLKSVHHAGKFLMAHLPKSSTENERSTVVIETPSKTQILLRQIAGLVARRIVTYAKEGDNGKLNDELGFIKFGSRVDLFLPLDTEIYVKMGEKTIGNKTIIGRLKE